MKKQIIIPIIAAIFAAGNTNATPVIEQQTALNDHLTLNDLVPLGSVSFDNLPKVKGSVNFDTSASSAVGANVNLNSKWTPSWLSRSPMGWWHSWQGWNDWADQPASNTVPEPATMLLFGAALAGVAMVTRKKLKK